MASFYYFCWTTNWDYEEGSAFLDVTSGWFDGS